MVKFRNVAGDGVLSNWWDNGNNAIAFSRGNKAFIVINNEDGPIDNTFSTGLPAGQYCDIITGDLEGISRFESNINFFSKTIILSSGGKCSGRTITVGGDGKAHISVDNKTDDPVVAIHVQAKV